MYYLKMCDYKPTAAAAAAVAAIIESTKFMALFSMWALEWLKRAIKSKL